VSESPEELAVAFANTVYAVRGRPGDAIGDDGGVDTWLREHGLGGQAADVDGHAADADGPAADGAALRALRDAVRKLFAAAVANEAPSPAALAAVNGASAAAPAAATLEWRGADRAVAERRTADPATATRARLATAVIALLGGPHAGTLRACQGPRCVQYLLQDHPRRAFCSDGCSTRARAARYYARRRSGAG
jgi:predicted RNA-binding Zn ribbon-like protein